MKKCIMCFILGVMVCLSVQVFASNVFNAQQATYDVYVKGEKLISDKPILSVNGNTYLSLTAVGSALNVPVEWNAQKRQVEISMKEASVTTISNLKSNTLKIEEVPYEKVVAKDNKYYVAQLAFASYIKSEDGKFYLQLPDKDRFLIKGEGTVCSITVDGRTYIDLAACKVPYKVDGDTLTIE